MGQAEQEHQSDSGKQSTTDLPEGTQYLVQDALRCFSLVQVLNGAIASLVTLVGYLYKQGTFSATHQALPWSLLRFGFLSLVGLVSHKALSTKREYPWGVKRYTLVHAAIYLQLAWFSSELVLASTAVALAPRIMGHPSEETQFSYVPASAALQVYGCGVLITAGAALCFSSRQRRHLQSTRGDQNSTQFMTTSRSVVRKVDHESLMQPLLPEAAV